MLPQPLAVCPNTLLGVFHFREWEPKMPKPPPVAATKQSCLQRLQSLQQQFLHIDSPAELADAVREGAHILALLLHFNHVDPDMIRRDLPVGRDVQTGIRYHPGARRKLLGYAAEILSPNADENRKTAGYQGLWDLALAGSDQERTVAHKIRLEPDWVIEKPTGNVPLDSELVEFFKNDKYAYYDGPGQIEHMFIDRAEDYRQQGKRYALFTAELIARIEATQAAPLDAEQNATDKPKQARGMSKPERERIVAGILATEGTQRKLTAKDVYQIATKAGHRTSESAVKATEAFRYYTERIGTSRQKNRPTEYSSDRLEELADESRHIKRTARKTKPLEPEE